MNGANARQISAVPVCVFVLRTSVHIRPPTVTLLILLLPAAEATYARSNSFPAVVDKGGGDAAWPETIWSTDRPAALVTMNLSPLLACPPTLTTTLPVVAPVGTLTTMLPAFQLVTIAAVPLNVTAP